MSPTKPRVMLGELLIEKGVISQDQLRIALTEQKKRDIPLGKVLVDMGFLTEAMMRDMLGEALGQESVDLSQVVVDSDAVKLIPKAFAQRNHILPITYDKQAQRLTVAMANTFDVVAMDKIRGLLGESVQIKVLLAGEAEILNAIDQFFGFELSVEGILQELETGEVDQESLLANRAEYSQPIVRLVDSLISDAVKRGASDIHFEPEESFFRIRYRIDGVLRHIHSLHKKYAAMITVRIKVLAGMNITESRAPQDGRFSLQLFGAPVDFRASSMAVTHGENVVLRILDRSKGILSLEELELSDQAMLTLKLLMARPEGIILVTGPTGSGKTTTLYAMLDWLNKESVNIMTLEDPVEYPLPMVRQANVNPDANMGFAQGIRTLMRQDPDIILVGEIRDEETAEMAFRAAMTGHQVFSTVHANSAIRAITRLKDIGVSREVMVGNLAGIMAQRLVRKLCSYCREPYQPNEMERKLLGLGAEDQQVTIYRPKGCAYCDHQGYKGRRAILEVIKIDREVESLIDNDANHDQLQRAMVEKGFWTLADDGSRNVLEGHTSLEEITRVVDLTERIQ